MSLSKLIIYSYKSMNKTECVLLILFLGFLLFYPLLTKAEDVEALSLKYGVGVAESAKDGHSETKTMSFAYRNSIMGPFVYVVNTGFWTDTRSDLNRHGSLFGSIGPGLYVDAGSVYGEASCGLGVISQKDSMLGGRFPQFDNNMGVGIKDKNNYAIGLNYHHVSSAGIEKPNRGRDFIEVKLTFPINF